jgi:uncharacterized protein YceK
MKNLTLFIILSSSMLLSGCASMFSGTKQSIGIKSEMQGVKLYINDQYLGEGSVFTTVSKGNLSNAILTAKKEGCIDDSQTIPTKVDATSFLGCLIDLCVFSVLLTDTLITGAIREAERSTFVLNPKCDNPKALTQNK